MLEPSRKRLHGSSLSGRSRYQPLLRIDEPNEMMTVVESADRFENATVLFSSNEHPFRIKPNAISFLIWFPDINTMLNLKYWNCVNPRFDKSQMFFPVR